MHIERAIPAGFEDKAAMNGHEGCGLWLLHYCRETEIEVPAQNYRKRVCEKKEAPLRNLNLPSPTIYRALNALPRTPTTHKA